MNRFAGINENGNSDVVSQSWRPGGERYIMNRGGAATGYVYDGIGRLSYLVDDLPNGAGINWTFARNPAGQIVRDTRSNDAYAWTGHYSVSRAYQANGLNQYIQAGGAHFAYDANGNLISDGSRTFTYDVENRLVAVGGSGSAALRYDPLGRLYETAGGASAPTRFLYDGDALVAEYNAAGAVLRRYAHGDGVDEPLLWYEGPGVSWQNRRQLFADHQGSIVAVADAYGNRLSLNAYDEYGIPASANGGRFQYTGQIWLPELGMYHYKARAYSPTLGRFMQTDPVGYQGGINLYAYVANDPVNMTDPDGQNPAIDGRVAGLMSLPPAERLEALSYIGGALTAWVPGPEDVLVAAWVGRTIGRALVPRRAGPVARRVWRPGQSPHASTRAGNSPSRRTVTRREWRNEAERPTRNDFTPDDRERMSSGLPPQRVNERNPRNGGVESMERAHEPIPHRDGGRATRPLWPEEHEARDACRRTGYCRR